MFTPGGEAEVGAGAAGQDTRGGGTLGSGHRCRLGFTVLGGGLGRLCSVGDHGVQWSVTTVQL